MKFQMIGLLLCLSACRAFTTSTPQSADAFQNDLLVDASLCRDSNISPPPHRQEGSAAKIGVKASPKARVASGKTVPSATEKKVQKDQYEVYANPKKNIRCPDDLATAEKVAENLGLTATPSTSPGNGSGTQDSTNIAAPAMPQNISASAQEQVDLLVPVDPKQPALAATRPLYIADPVAPLQNEEAGFGCYGACGASCACAGRINSTETREEMVDGVKMECQYEVVNCFTHPFCRWHDACYYGCDHSYTTNSFVRATCYRTCDSGCLTGRSPSPIMKKWPDLALDVYIPDAPFSPMRCKRFITNDNTDLYEERMAFSRRTTCRPLSP